ncbi:hypothetical protein LINPERHAP1_LOCUS9735 [Linum perenne]
MELFFNPQIHAGILLNLPPEMANHISPLPIILDHHQVELNEYFEKDGDSNDLTVQLPLLTRWIISTSARLRVLVRQ